jgi:hypothetical protein
MSQAAKFHLVSEVAMLGLMSICLVAELLSSKNVELVS